MNEILKLRAKAQLEIYHKDKYSIYSFVPITPYPEELELNQEYLSFSCDGDLSWVTKGKEYELEIEAYKRNNRGVMYRIVSVPSLSLDGIENLSVDESMEIMREITTSSPLS